MKQFIFMLALLLCAVVGNAQSGSKFVLQTSDTNDTLKTSTTLTYDLNTLLVSGQDFSRQWTYSVTIEADSLSGANAGTITLQVSDSPISVASASALWADIDTGTIDGATTQVFHFTGDLVEPRMRIKITSPSGTRSTALRTFVTLKKKNE